MLTPCAWNEAGLAYQRERGQCGGDSRFRILHPLSGLCPASGETMKRTNRPQSVVGGEILSPPPPGRIRCTGNRFTCSNNEAF